MSELKTIRLYGQMGAQFGRTHRFAVSSTSEAVQALCSQLPGFEQYLTGAKERGLTFAVFNGKRNLEEKDLNDPVGADDIRFAPVPTGSKRNGVLQTIVGAVLVVVGAVISFYGGGAGLPIMKMGIAMMAGGLVQMLTPTPKASAADSPDANASYTFNGPVNTQAQGNPVPLIYGRLIVGSAVISASIKANQEQVAGRNDTGIPILGGDRWSDRNSYLGLV